VRSGASVEMQTADSLIAIRDLTGLAAQLRKGGWGEREYLRLALVAYVSRSRGDENGARSYWRTALGMVADDQEKLQQLESLAASWDWRAEKMEALARLYGNDPGNRDTFAELMSYYRSTGRTADLVSVLNTYVLANPRDQTQRCGLAYYSMLSGLNVSQAYVSAQEAYKAAPKETLPRLVYAFALWKQRRASEAWDLLQEIKPDKTEVVPVALLQAAVLADMEQRDAAAGALKSFNASRALPEEASLATVLASRLKKDSSVTRLN